jgi:nucleotide-binding universal stress UspA family protein
MKIIPGRLQGFGELIVELLLNFMKGAAGEKNAQAIVMSAHREPLFRELFGRVSDHVGL